MADAYWAQGTSPDDGWGPSTSVRSTTSDQAAPRLGGRRRRAVGEPAPTSLAGDAYAGSPWAPTPDAAAPAAGTAPAGKTRRRGKQPSAAVPGVDPAVARPKERGVPGWLALLVVLGVTILGILVDTMRGQQLGSGFNIGIIAGSVVSILIVRRSAMFPVVVAPPIVYSLCAGVSLYVRSNGLSDRSVLIDAATNWLVYGFPAIAAASAAVLIVAGIRLITRR